MTEIVPETIRCVSSVTPLPVDHRAELAKHFNLWAARGGKVDFPDALRLIKKGERMCRAGWNGKAMFIFLVPGSRFKVSRAPLLGIYPEGTEIEYHAHIDMKTAQGYVVPWLASQADLLAEDWEIASVA